MVSHDTVMIYAMSLLTGKPIDRIYIEAGNASDADLEELMEAFKGLTADMGRDPANLTFIITRPIKDN